VDAFVFETIREALLRNGKDVSQLEVWFKKDTNAIPPVYILQPISSILLHYKDKVRASRLIFLLLMCHVLFLNAMAS
jgi:hypothetical protein